MRKTPKYLLLVVLLNCCNILQGQKVSFNRVKPPKNLPIHLIGAMAQDASGFMWFISGPSLIRYDGYHFKTYTSSNVDTHGLRGTSLSGLHIDRDGIIWVGDLFEGLNRFDPATGKSIYFPYIQDNVNGISSGHISMITEDTAGNLWIATNKGLDILERETGKFIHYYHDPKNPRSLTTNDVQAVYRDKSGTMWVGTGEAFHSVGAIYLEGGLNQFDAASRSFTRYTHNPDDPKSLSDNRVKSIFEDSRGVFWIGVAGKDGLHTMDRKTGKFTRHIYDPANPAKLARSPQQRSVPFADDHISFINEDAVGNIWIGTYEGALTRYNPATGTTTHFGGTNEPGDLQEYGTWSMFSSRDGVMWLGSWGETVFNLYTVDPLKHTHNVLIAGIAIGGLLELRAGGICLAGTGLTIVDDKKNVIKKYLADSTAPGEKVLNFINCVIEDKKGIIWLGTSNDGLVSFDPVNEKAKYHGQGLQDSLKNEDPYILTLLEDRSGTLWVGTSNGLQIFERKSGKFRLFENSDSYDPKWITSLVETSSGDVWAGVSQNEGLFKVDKATKRFVPYVSGVSVAHIYEDSRKTLWACTSDGLFFKENSSDQFLRYTDMNFEMEQIQVTHIMEDDNKNLWITGPNEFYVIDAQRKSSLIFPYAEQSNSGIYQTRCGLKLKSGELIYGNIFGIDYLNPGKDVKSNTPPDLVIEQVSVIKNNGNKNEEIINGSLADNVAVYELKHYQNSFSVLFTGIHFKDPAQNRHLYMLEGLDNQWRKPDADHKASLYNVAPGNYTLKLAVSNANGMWTHKTIRIVISPAWWNTLAFRIIAIAAAVAVLYFSIRWRLHEKFRIHLERSEKETQLADLKHKTAELEIHALRAQMNPHFIFNSLNSINRFILQNNRIQASEYLTKFSKLVRLVFQNSQAAFVVLDSELDALRLYLELEALRFDNHFEFTISVSPELDTATLKIPPLIIQPYAENAIWHGLMHKTEKGNLEIDIYPEGDVLICKIKDDGIGRKKSAEIRGSSRSTHKSMGMRITADRITLLQQQNMIQDAIHINDLILADGTPGGTEIIIKMPLRYD